MPTPLILLDTSTQAWQVGVTNAGLLTTTAIAGTAPAFVLINDTTLTTTWQLKVLTSGMLQIVATTSQVAPLSYLLQAPNTALWSVRVNNGFLQTILGAKNTIIGGSFQDAQGNPVAFGTLLLQLPQDAVTSQPSLICSAIQLQIPLDANGNVAGSISVWPTDQLTPNTLLYTAWVLTNSNAQVWGPHKEVILSSPSPFNLDVWSTIS